MYVCRQTGIYVSMCIHTYISYMHAYIYVSECKYMQVYLHTYRYVDTYFSNMCSCTYIYMYAHVYLHKYKYIHMHTYMCCRNKYVPYYDKVLIFWWGTLHYSIMMMSLCYVANDIISLS